MRHQVRQRANNVHVADGVCSAMRQMEAEGLLEQYQADNGQWMARLTPKGIREADLLAESSHTTQMCGGSTESERDDDAVEYLDTVRRPGESDEDVIRRLLEFDEEE